MIRTQSAIAVVSAVLLVLAGCTGGMSSAPTGDVGTTAPSGADVGDGGDGGAAGSASAISFYLSDKPSAIDDFEHLNVTITKVGFHRVASDGTETDPTTANETPSPETTIETPTEPTATDQPTATATATTTATATATLTADPEDGGEAEDQEHENETDQEQDRDRDEDDEQDREEEKEHEQDREQDRDGNGEWVTKDVNHTTVDLTELQGANATKLDVLEVAPGTYDKVFIYVGEINATLKNGEQVRVKLPSERLHVNKRFTVGDGDAIDFVFDVSVFKAGKSGKYILKPVVSQTGTGDEVEIDSVDEDDDDGTDDDEKSEVEGGDDGDDRDEADDREGEGNQTHAETLTAELRGAVKPGQTVTMAVSRAGDPVANATVEVNDERVGTTGAEGTIEVEVPTDAEELEIEITKGEAELEIERTLRGGGGNGGNGGNGNGG